MAELALAPQPFDVYADWPEVVCAVFARHGGVSAAPFASLNLSRSVGDADAAVSENRRRAFAALDWPAMRVASAAQVHGADVYHMRAPLTGAPPEVDVLITDTPELALFMRFADCTPVVLVDPVRRALALVHAGWRGTLAGAAARAVGALGETFGTRAEDVRAWIGPAIGPCCYRVGDAVSVPARARYGEDAQVLVPQADGGVHFNLWEANRRELVGVGVRDVRVAGVCTACAVDTYFSHRAERGRTGRFGVYVGWRGR